MKTNTIFLNICRVKSTKITLDEAEKFSLSGLQTIVGKKIDDQNAKVSYMESVMARINSQLARDIVFQNYWNKKKRN